MSPQTQARKPASFRSRPKKTAPETPPVADLTAPFVKYLRDQDRSPKTVESYAGDVQQFAKWVTETRGKTYLSLPEFIRTITSADIRDYRDYLLDVQHASPATINHRLVTLGLLTRWARHAGWIEGDPVDGIEPVKQTAQPPRWLDRKEQFALRRAAEKGGDPRNLAILLLLLNTGLRVSEVAGLTLADVQLSERKGEITVRAAGERGVSGDRSRGAKRDSQETQVRTIPLNAEIRQALREYLAKRPKVEHDALFVGQKGEPLGKLGIEYQIGVLGRVAGFKQRLTPQMLRHTFAKNLVDQDVPLNQVAALMGHRSLTTMARYTRPSPQNLARAVEKLEEK